MKYKDIYQKPELVKAVAEALHRTTTKNWTLMEVCGGQTHSIVKYGLDALLPPQITLLHGPGCPVCVTPVEKIDRAIALAKDHNVILCSFGDMLRVPGTKGDLLAARSEGADVRVVYSPLDAVKIAENNLQREVVFFAVGFETTAPANALAILQAYRRELLNFSLLVSHVMVPPVLQALLKEPDCKVQGILAAGHVCTVMGTRMYEPLAERYQVPIVVTGFEPVDILYGVQMCVRQLEEGRHEVENAYPRVVKEDGNLHARYMVQQVFETEQRVWRGIGALPGSGLGIRKEYAAFDAEKRFCLQEIHSEECPDCISGLILQGRASPVDCPVYKIQCTPDHPLGAPMVSSEGVCAAYYQYGRGAK